MSHGSVDSPGRDLWHGLHHVLATVILDPESSPDSVWWKRLPSDEATQHRASTGNLSLPEIAELYSHPPFRASLDRALGTLGVTLPGHAELTALFQRAIVSSRAHSVPPERVVVSPWDAALWETVCAPVGRALAQRYHTLAAAPPISRHATLPLPGTRETLARLLAFDTSPGSRAHTACVQWLCGRLEALGFTCSLHQPLPSAPAVIEAHRSSLGLAGHVVLYNHYDVTLIRHGGRGWATPPQVLTEEGGRWFGHGVGDNKGPLAARLVALASFERAPAITWFIQGEEETGSVASSLVLRERLSRLQAELWLEETGYHDDEDGTLRLIARTLGPSAGTSNPPDSAMRELLHALRLLAGRWGVGTRLEVRGLNKVAVEGGCPFNNNLPAGARYLALGVNDSRSRIHGTNESVPLWTFPLHAEELQVVFHWVDRVARGLT
ncbi:M20/M25/M40 family metallo-hydrolase [Hyalangium gracile]|uniref:M20/M25/M40 family metallo-hydrolase n=1 Tax=Hyalangium gracile TaxID=394092 RepID=UPI001CCD7596|nr:M20/M25/M40 family metallo-hydrolase [Hyalangium gracile]